MLEKKGKGQVKNRRKKESAKLLKKRETESGPLAGGRGGN